MKTIVAIAIFGACIFGMTSALQIDASCNAKIQQFRDCGEKSRAQRETESKTRDQAIEACYKTSGCTAPVREEKQDPDRQKKEACQKDIQVALKAKVQTCVQGKIQGLTFPQDEKRREEGHRGSRGGHDDKGIQKACGTNTAAVATVKACIKSASPPSGPDQQKARFDQNCKARAQCDAILDVKCKSQLDEAKKALCECGQQAHADASAQATLRATTPSCAGLPAPKPRQGGQPEKQRSCDESGKVDYCKEGFDKFQADRKAQEAARGGKHPGGDGH